MFRKTLRLKRFALTPLRMIEWVYSITAIVGGVYILTLIDKIPELQNASSLIRIIVTPTGVALYGLTYASAGLIAAIGLIKGSKTIRSWGLFLNILTRLYALIAIYLYQGFYPLSWLTPLHALLIAIIAWFVIKREPD